MAASKVLDEGIGTRFRTPLCINVSLIVAPPEGHLSRSVLMNWRFSENIYLKLARGGEMKKIVQCKRRIGFPDQINSLIESIHT